MTGLGIRALAALALLVVVAASPGPAEARYAAIVIDGDTGRVLHSAEADTRRYPASLTKIMTLFMVFEALDRGEITLDTRLTVSANAAARPPSKVGIPACGAISVHDAIMVLATKSANDVATAVAENLGGSEAAFARMMTARARELGMASTTFRNASGLPDDGQVTTARDMAVLTMALYEQLPHHVHVFQAREHRYAGQVFRNHNRLLASYPGMIGVKTGYIRASGFNLAASVRRNGHHIFAVVFGGDTAASRDAQMERLLDRAFASLQRVEVQLASVAPPKRKPSWGIAEAQPEERPRATFSIAAEAKPLLEQGSVDATAPIALQSPPAEVARTPQWAVQVGAFSEEKAAQRALDLSVRTLPDILAATRPTVIEHEDQFGTLYRARHTGLTEQEARIACEQLQLMRLACMVAAPDSAM